MLLLSVKTLSRLKRTKLTMASNEVNPLFKIDISDEVENTFAEDDVCDIEDDIGYEEHRWPKEHSTGYSYKGKKKVFLKAVETLRILMKKGHEKAIEKVTFKVLDSRKTTNGNEYDIEVCKDKERGVAVLKVFGPTKKKGATLMINKSKKYEVKFVEILAIDVVKQLLDRFDCGNGWLNTIQVIPNNEQHFCNKGFATEKNVKTHIEKFHKVDGGYLCDLYDFESEKEEDLNRHVKDKHVSGMTEVIMNAEVEITDQPSKDVKEGDGNEESMEVDSKDADEEEQLGNKRNRNKSVSDSPGSSPPSKKAQEELLGHTTSLPEVIDVSETELKLKVIEFKNTIQKLITDHEKFIVEKHKEFNDLNKAMDILKKENGSIKRELKQVKEENVKLNLEVGKNQYEKDRLAAKNKSKEKIEKIKNNTKLFNDMIQKQIDDGEIVNVDISMHQNG